MRHASLGRFLMKTNNDWKRPDIRLLGGVDPRIVHLVAESDRESLRVMADDLYRFALEVRQVVLQMDRQQQFQQPAQRGRGSLD